MSKSAYIFSPFYLDGRKTPYPFNFAEAATSAYSATVPQLKTSKRDIMAQAKVYGPLLAERHYLRSSKEYYKLMGQTSLVGCKQQDQDIDPQTVRTLEPDTEVIDLMQKKSLFGRSVEQVRFTRGRTIGINRLVIQPAYTGKGFCGRNGRLDHNDYVQVNRLVLTENGTFVSVTQRGYIDSHPVDVLLYKRMRILGSYSYESNVSDSEARKRRTLYKEYMAQHSQTDNIVETTYSQGLLTEQCTLSNEAFGFTAKNIVDGLTRYLVDNAIVSPWCIDRLANGVTHPRPQQTGRAPLPKMAQ